MAGQGRAIVLAALALLLSAAGAQAAFMYDTTVTFSPAGTGGTSSGVTISPVTTMVNGVNETGYLATFGGTSIELLGASRSGFSVPGNDTIDAADLVATSTTSAGTTGDSFTLGYTLNLGLTNNPPPGSAGSQSLPVSGVLTMSDVNTGNGTITNAFTTPTSGNLDAGGVSFSAGIDTYSPPTINGSPNSFGGFVDASPVPEPACATLMVLGALPLLRRSRQSTE